jgi:hypothetical protein
MNASSQNYRFVTQMDRISFLSFIRPIELSESSLIFRPPKIGSVFARSRNSKCLSDSNVLLQSPNIRVLVKQGQWFIFLVADT